MTRENLYDEATKQRMFLEKVRPILFLIIGRYPS